MKVNLIANIFGTTGFAIHSKNLARALKQEGADLSIETFLPPNHTSLPEWLEFREEIEKNGSLENTIMIASPEWWSIKSGDRLKKFIPFGIFEGTRVPEIWIKTAENDYITTVAVPSEHTKKAFEIWGNEKVNKKLKVIPHGTDLDVFNPIVKEANEKKRYFTDVNVVRQEFEPLKKDKFRFLFVGGWRSGIQDRKGLDIALRAFCAEFKPDEPVEFFLKINAAYQDSNTVINNMNALGLPEQRPQISISMDTIPEIALARLYRESDCFVMPTKGEAFCIPCLEAMACGVPVIATDFGGQTDYLPKDGLIKIEKMIPTTAEPWIYEWAEWALPSQSHLQELMRKAYEGKIAGHPEMAKEYSWRNEAKKLMELLV